MLSLTLFLAREWAAKGVRVNSITPGFFPAEQNRKLLFNDDGSPTARTRSILGHTPVGRFGEPRELIGAARSSPATRQVHSSTGPIFGWMGGICRRRFNRGKPAFLN